MNFSKQLKIYRERDGFSQEELAEKIYVTRQTISKWENDHTYPDIHNLIALSTLFDVTLDELVKGDVEIMKKSIDVEKMNRLTWVMLLFIGMMALSVGPLVDLLGWYGLIIPLIFWGISMIAALKIEKIKKEKNIKTYAEIIAFTEGKNIDTIRQTRDKNKFFWNKTRIVVIFSLIVGAIAAISALLWGWVS